MYLSFLIGLILLVTFGILLSQRKGTRKGRSRAIPQVSVSEFPIRIPYLDTYYMFSKYRKEGLQLVTKWMPRYNEHSLIQICPWPFSLICITDASLYQKVLSSSKPSHLNKPVYYSVTFSDHLKDGLLSADHGTWFGHRKALSKAFTYNALQTYFNLMQRNSKSLIKAKLFPLTSKGEDGTSQEIKGKEMYEALSSCVVETALDLIMGSSRHDIDVEETEGFLRNSCIFHTISLYRMFNPLFYPNFIWNLHPKRREQTKAIKASHEYISKVIGLYMTKMNESEAINDIKSKDNIEEDDDTLQTVPGEKCLIESMLSSGLSHEEIYHEVAIFLFVGQETTENALNYLLFDLALNVEDQDRCRKEVDEIFGTASLDNDFERNLSMENFSNLKYLERCIMESMRLTPTIPFIGRTLNSSLELNEDYVLQPGENVLIPIWAIHRDSKYFPNPEKFYPDRFLPEEIKKRPFGAYIPFSLGPRNCIGWKFAMMQMKVEMMWLLRNFTFRTTNRRSDVKLLYDVVTRPEKHPNIILTHRVKH